MSVKSIGELETRQVKKGLDRVRHGLTRKRLAPAPTPSAFAHAYVVQHGLQEGPKQHSSITPTKAS